MKKIVLVAGARPNFMKIAPILRVLENTEGLSAVLVHTGQHYDENMSDSFFAGLGIRDPDYYLNVGSASHAVQTAAIMVEFETVCYTEKPDLVLVVGDVNSTIAAGLVAKKLQIALCHVEAGLRSGDRNMPEEINRLATDSITDVFFTTEQAGTDNLLSEGHQEKSVHFVGHVMIDNLMHQLKKLENESVSEKAKKLKLTLAEKYICTTLHRPSNVDNSDVLRRLVGALEELSTEVPVVFPCHPRTLDRLEKFGLKDKFVTIDESYGKEIVTGMYLTPPLSYDDFLYLWKDAAVLLTDSGGLQEESTALGIPCITMRENTERPITVEIGSNVVVGTDADKIVELGRMALGGNWKACDVPPLWDGKASERIVNVLKELTLE